MNPLSALIIQNQTQIKKQKETPACRDEVNRYLSILTIIVFLEGVLVLIFLATVYNLINSTYASISKVDSTIPYNLALLPILLLMFARPVETLVSLINNAYFVHKNYTRLNSYIIKQAFNKGVFSVFICVALIISLYSLLAPYILVTIPVISSKIPTQNQSIIFWGLLIIWCGATLFDKWLGNLNSGMKLDALWDK
jgi:hypothetical protein